MPRISLNVAHDQIVLDKSNAREKPIPPIQKGRIEINPNNNPPKQPIKTQRIQPPP